MWTCVERGIKTIHSIYSKSQHDDAYLLVMIQFSAIPFAFLSLPNSGTSVASRTRHQPHPALGFVDPPLFDYERKKLTNEILSKLSSENARLFSFDDDGVAPETRSGFCKAFPGDDTWPSMKIWDQLDQLTDGALIPTSPLAAPCYKNWGVYNQAKCASITANFSDPYLQYALASDIPRTDVDILTVKMIQPRICGRFLRAEHAFQSTARMVPVP